MPLDLSNLKIHEPVLQQMQKLSGHITFDKIDEKGSNGYTCFGTHEILGRKIVVKFHYWSDGQADYAEPKRLAQLKHPAILDIYDANPLDSDWAYFITPLCENGDADRYVGGAILSLHEAIDAAVQILSGLSYLHFNGFVHRDLKPSNIFVDAKRNFVIGDFGTVRNMTDGWSTNRSSHTLFYQPPETVLNPQFHKTGDIYQLGIVLYQFLGGHLPYDELDYLSFKERRQHDLISDEIDRILFAKDVVQRRITRSKILNIKSLQPWVPASLRKVIIKSTKCSYLERYESAAEMSAALTACRAKVRPWEFRGGIPTLVEATQYRIVPKGAGHAVEKRRKGDWRSISDARDMRLVDAVNYAENGG